MEKRPKGVTVLPEPWRSMTEEDAKKFTEDDSRRMLASVSTPELDVLRQNILEMRTSELIMCIAHTNTMSAKLFAGEALWRYSNEDEQLIMAAALVALSDEVDRRIPRPG